MELYQKSVVDVLQQFHADAQRGLTAAQVALQCELYGPNALPSVASHSWFSIFISQFKNPLIYMLLIAATIIFFVGEDTHDAFIISAVLLFNAVIGAVQEGRTHSILDSLKRFMSTSCVVLRDGSKQVVEDTQLVVGDIIFLVEGQRVPADARIIESNNLTVDESALTGESGAQRKVSDSIGAIVPLAERTNMIYKGTYVLSGSARAVVVATGLATEIGKIHHHVQEITTEIPLRKELERLSYLILLSILALCVLLFVVGIATGRELGQLLTMLTALFICVVPEGLPVVLTLVLVTGAYRMARQKVLVKNLQAVEALGRADVILTDKTGTLTRNELMVSRVCTTQATYQVSGNGYLSEGVVHAADSHDESLSHISMACSLMNTAEISYQKESGLFDIKGDPTEAALYIFSQKMGCDRAILDAQHVRVYEIPFDSAHKIHALFLQRDATGVVYVVGAPEVVLGSAHDTPESITIGLDQLLSEGLRVVAIAMKEYDIQSAPSSDTSENERMQFYMQMAQSSLKVLGLLGIQDSIRPEVRTIIDQARSAGLSIVMVTGDHLTTALYVARATDIYTIGDTALDGTQLAHMSDAQLMHALTTTTVFSRVSPDQKLRIVQLFQKTGNIVAMTGDGINDAPSLVAADLGIAMGNIGTEVAKAAADLVLLDDSFVNVVHAIEEGRHIFYTLRKVVLYFFATNMGEVLIVLFALLAGLPLPITAAQILWLNLVTDGFLDAGLSMEPKEPGLLERRRAGGVRMSQVRLVDGWLLAKMMYMAIPMALGSLAIFWYYHADLAHARTMTLITMALYQWFNAWNCRSETRSVWSLGVFKNKWLIVATGFVLSLQFFVLYIPFMQHLFNTVPLSLYDWVVMIAATIPMLLIEELRKAIVMRWNQ